MEASYGRAIIVAGMVPSLLFVALNLSLLWLLDLIVIDLEDLRVATAIALLIATAGGVLGTLLIALNGLIIHFYEGAFSFQRRWLLRPAQRRNLRRHETLYQSLHASRRMHESALVDADRREPEERLRRARSAALAIDEAHAQLEGIEGDRLLPIDASFVTPTALGNAYAVMEAYSYERYGIDSMIFWPRLLAVLPEDYRNSISEQKTTCDFLLNLSLLLAVFAVELLVVPAVAGAMTAGAGTVAALAAAVIAVLVAYGLYRAAVAETRILGKLIGSGFDLYRDHLLRQFGLRPPLRLDEEQRLWRRLALFIRRGEPFYYPDEARYGQESGEERVGEQ